MRITRVIFSIAALAVALPCAAGAQVESTPIPASQKPNFAPMQFMLGTWTCSTKSARRPAPYLSTSTYTMDPSGWWINETTTTTPMKWFQSQSKLVTYDKITYDSDTHRWADVSYGTPNAFGLSFASGWNGNRIVWHDVSFAPTADISGQTDSAVTKVSNTKFTASSSFTEAKTGRHVAVTTVCTKH